MLNTSRISLERIQAAAQIIDPVFLHSPQFVCEPLSAALGCELWLKIETMNPIRSFKGRGADLLVANADPAQPLLCASAGNFGQAMAYACRKRGIPLTVYASVQANPLKIERMRQLGAEVVLYGEDFDAAKREARRVAAAQQARFVEDSLDIETVEGAGTIGLELLAIDPPLDVLLIALGNGALCNGIAHAVKQIRPRTHVIAVQAAGAPAMVESWRSGQIVEYDQIATIADGIGVRIPVPVALQDLEGQIDDALLVQEETIIAAMRMLHEHAGVVVEPSGAVGVAALLEHTERFHDLRVGTIVCGGNLTTVQMRMWLG